MSLKGWQSSISLSLTLYIDMIIIERNARLPCFKKKKKEVKNIYRLVARIYRLPGIYASLASIYLYEPASSFGIMRFLYEPLRSQYRARRVYNARVSYIHSCFLFLFAGVHKRAESVVSPTSSISWDSQNYESPRPD